MITRDDWLWFHDHEGRAYRCRLATPAEIELLEAQDVLKDKTLAEGCAVFVISRFVPSPPDLKLQQLLIVLERDDAPEGEDECAQAWDDAEATLLGWRVIRRVN
jgi:hypothetical protein